MGLNEQQESDSFYKAVSTHLAILAVGPWDKYKDDLSPHFKMNPDLALSMVAPTTTAIKANQRSQTSAAVNVGITGRPDSTSGNNTVNTPATVSPSIAHLDPIMQHSAALSLLQEVRVLNKYLRHVPQEQDSRPFLIRLQLSILPTKRSQPYDVYTDISFLSDELGIIKATTKLFVEDNNDIYHMNDFDCIALKSAFMPSKTVKSETKPIKDEEEKQETDNSRLAYPAYQLLPTVIPLLVTDNIESIADQRVRQATGQYSFSGNAAYNGLPTGVELQKEIELLSNIVSSELNSLFTLAQLNKNTVRVRVGAMTTSYGHAMISSTHNVTLLVLVPHSHDNLRITSRSFIRNVDTGSRMPQYVDSDYYDMYSEYVDALQSVGKITVPAWAIGPLFISMPKWLMYGNNEDSLASVRVLRMLAVSDEFDKFQACLIQWGWNRKGISFSENFWLRALDSASATGQSHITVTLPR